MRLKALFDLVAERNSKAGMWGHADVIQAEVGGIIFRAELKDGLGAGGSDDELQAGPRIKILSCHEGMIRPTFGALYPQGSPFVPYLPHNGQNGATFGKIWCYTIRVPNKCAVGFEAKRLASAVD